MEKQIHECLDYYKKLMQGCKNLNGNDLKKRHEEKRDVAISKLLEENPIKKNSPHIKSLQNDLSAQYEVYCEDVLRNQVEECLRYYSKHMSDVSHLNGNELRERHKVINDKTIIKLMKQNPILNHSVYVERLQAGVNTKYEDCRKVVLQKQVEECLRYYNENMPNVSPLKEKELSEKHKKINEEAVSKLMRQNPILNNSVYVQQLQAEIRAEYEIHIGRHLCVEYSTEWATKADQEGNFKESVVSKFFLEEGKKYVQKISEKVTNKSSQKVVFNEFVETMSEKFIAEINRRERNRRRAKTAGAATGGLFAAAFSILIPPLGAVAGALIAGGIGAAGAAATGGSTYIIDKLVQNKVDVPDLWVFINPILGDEQTKSKSISVTENDCETQPLLP